MSEHPPLFRLDAHAAGDHDARVEDHLTGCTTCAAYVERLREAVRASSDDAGSKSADYVLGLDDIERARGAYAGKPPTRPVKRIAFVSVSVLAAAAALVLVTRSGLPVTGEDAVTETASMLDSRFAGLLAAVAIKLDALLKDRANFRTPRAMKDGLAEAVRSIRETLEATGYGHLLADLTDTTDPAQPAA